MVRGCWAAKSYYSIKSNNSLGSLKKVAREYRMQLTAKQRNIVFIKVNSTYKPQKFSQSSTEIVSDFNKLTTSQLN